MNWRKDVETRPAGYVIVGKVSDGCATVWIKGRPRYARALLTLGPSGRGESEQGVQSKDVDLQPTDDNIAIATFHGLDADKPYEVTATFRTAYGSDDRDDSCRKVRATFQTPPFCAGGERHGFSFLLGSCNLSVVSINNLAVRALQIIGVYAARQSLRRPIDADPPLPEPGESFKSKFGRWWMQNRTRRRLVDLALKLGVGAIFVGTGGKWPKQPLLRSPFLKLEALFAGQAVHFDRGFKAPMPGDEIKGSLSGASGILAFAPRLNAGGGWQKKDENGRYATSREEQPKTQEAWDLAKGSLILVSVTKSFVAGERLYIFDRNEAGAAPTDRGTVGYILDVAEVRSDYEPPRFTVHAGDQIYFDFPNAKRPPELARYHEAYREAWFEDRHQRAFLARGAHYMTLDDHEIVDQYAVDLDPLKGSKPPNGYTKDDFSRKRYQHTAMEAYRAYVRQRHDEPANYFDFSYAHAQYFVLDTRTERRRRPDLHMIDPNPHTRMLGNDQMAAFASWLGRHKDDLKFVVSSVPFVADVLPAAGHDPTERKPDRSDDKWSGAAFRRQREEIIELIDREKIENLVFLVGDMHCAYHASMTIGAGQRWQRRCIHELAGGPINQLQHGRRHRFATAVRRITRGRSIPYDIRLHQFHSGANAVMHIEVASQRDDHLGASLPAIHWRVIRTMTAFDGGPEFDEDKGAFETIKDEAPISGRIVMRPALPRDDEERAAS